jgi:hypothetical protein
MHANMVEVEKLDRADVEAEIERLVTLAKSDSLYTGLCVLFLLKNVLFIVVWSQTQNVAK